MENGIIAIVWLYICDSDNKMSTVWVLARQTQGLAQWSNYGRRNVELSTKNSSKNQTKIRIKKCENA